MKLTRRQLVGAAAVTAAGAAGVYELLDRLAEKPERPEVTGPPPNEQHVLEGVNVIVDEGVEVLVPPLHHRVVTARVTAGETRRAVREARRTLEEALAALEAEYPVTPDGLAVVVAWGLPYFRRYVPAAARREIPVDLRASAQRGREVRVLEDAGRFPSDTEETILEDNDVAVFLRSDHLEPIDTAQRRLFDELAGIFSVTSIRRGFVGGGFDGESSVPKRMATAAGIPGSELMPPTAELFFGFTSTVKHALGPPRIANFETLGYADLRSPYFVHGTHMHLSHIHEDMLAWYLNHDHSERVDAMFKPGLEVAPARQTLSQPPDEAVSADELRRDFARHQRIGHAGAIQSASRLQRDVVGRDGTLYPKGTAVPLRADFNTLDNPFAWSTDPAGDAIRDEPASGVHFVVFNPTSDDFRRVRLAMDGVLPDGTRLPLEPRSRAQGINSVFLTTHRQNFLVPPRVHRSFPLSELRA